jgi:hypothetical protein
VNCNASGNESPNIELDGNELSHSLLTIRNPETEVSVVPSQVDATATMSDNQYRVGSDRKEESMKNHDAPTVQIV